MKTIYLVIDYYTAKAEAFEDYYDACDFMQEMMEAKAHENFKVCSCMLKESSIYKTN